MSMEEFLVRNRVTTRLRLIKVSQKKMRDIFFFIFFFLPFLQTLTNMNDYKEYLNIAILQGSKPVSAVTTTLDRNRSLDWQRFSRSHTSH